MSTLEAIGLAPPFTPTETQVHENTFRPSDGPIMVEVQNDSRFFRWRMRIGNETSQIMSYYQGILEWNGWLLATPYWEGTFPVMTPFRLSNIASLVDLVNHDLV